MVPDSLRGTDKRRNGPEFSNDIKKRKVDDKDSSHYVSKGLEIIFIAYLHIFQVSIQKYSKILVIIHSS